MRFALPFPSSRLSGHNTMAPKAAVFARNKLIATERAAAFHLARAAQRASGYQPPETGDIRITFTFYPPNNRGDRTNFANRMKAAIDGIAEALSINDKRFLPSYLFCDPHAPGRVEVSIGL